MLRRTNCRGGLQLIFVRHGESTNNVLRSRLQNNAGRDDARCFALARDPDPSLTSRGFEQARRVAERVAKEASAVPSSRPTWIVTSYFLRALQTAAAIESAMVHQRARGPTSVMTAQNGVRVLVDRDFHEYGGNYRTDHRNNAANASSAHTAPSFVGLPGRTTADVRAAFPTFHCVEGQRCETGWYKGATKETVEEAQLRARWLWNRLDEIGRSLLRMTTVDDHRQCQQQHDGATLVVITHGRLYALMMSEALKADMFVGDMPTTTFCGVANTAVARARLITTPGASFLAAEDFAASSPKLQLLSHNCCEHLCPSSIGLPSASIAM